MTWIDGCLVINLSRFLYLIAKPEWTPGPVLGHREVARMDILLGYWRWCRGDKNSRHISNGSVRWQATT
jgi:hypothetical protein